MVGSAGGSGGRCREAGRGAGAGAGRGRSVVGVLRGGRSPVPASPACVGRRSPRPVPVGVGRGRGGGAGTGVAAGDGGRTAAAVGTTGVASGGGATIDCGGLGGGGGAGAGGGAAWVDGRRRRNGSGAMNARAKPSTAPETGAVSHAVARAEIGEPVGKVVKSARYDVCSSLRCSKEYAARVCPLLGDSTRRVPMPGAV